MEEGVIAENQRCHGFNDGHGTRENTGIVAATAFEFRVLVIGVHCFL